MSSSTSVPPFQSTLPPEFLEGLDKRGTYLYTTIDEVRQAQAWLIERSREHGDTLAAVRQQCEKTNGRTSASESKIAALEADPGIKFARLGATLVKSKLFWAGVCIFLVVVAPWLVAHVDVVTGILTTLFT